MQLFNLIYLVCFLVIYLAADALHDVWVKNERDCRVNGKPREAGLYSSAWHALDAAIKGFVVLNIIYFLVGFSWWMPWLFFVSMHLRWLWFDACWNWFAGLSFWYRGSVAQSDKLKISNWVFFTLKFLLLISTITITIIYL